MRWFIDRLQDIDGHAFLVIGQLRPATLSDDDMWQKLPPLTAKCCIYTTALISASRADAPGEWNGNQTSRKYMTST